MAQGLMRTPPDPESTPPPQEPTLKPPSTRYQRQALTQLGIDMSDHHPRVLTECFTAHGSTSAIPNSYAAALSRVLGPHRRFQPASHSNRHSEPAAAKKPRAAALAAANNLRDDLKTEPAGVPPRCRVASLMRTNIGELVLSDVVLDERHAHGASADGEAIGLDGWHAG
jgi:hypothetical protein